jgi:release factor glutamine methyltransferase
MTQTLHALLTTGFQRLRATSPSPRLDVELLLAYVLGWERSCLIAERDTLLTAEQVDHFFRLLVRREDLEPIAYLTGHREFYGLDMLVNKDVLIPRPETELLVEIALTQAHGLLSQHNHDCSDTLQLADVGTGSGAIAIALAFHLPTVHIFATDISREALDVAAQNAARHQVEQRISFIHGHLLTGVPAPLDIIVSNPPYTIIAEIDEGVRRHEPHTALDGGSDGLALYRQLLAQCADWLRPGGFLILEMGATHALELRKLVDRTLPAQTVDIHRDLAGHERVLVVQT